MLVVGGATASLVKQHKHQHALGHWEGAKHMVSEGI